MIFYISIGVIMLACILYYMYKMIHNHKTEREITTDVKLVKCVDNQYEMVLVSDSDPTRKVFKDFFKWANYRQADYVSKGLWEAGYKTLEELKNIDDKVLLSIRGVGEGALKVIREKLDAYMKEI